MLWWHEYVRPLLGVALLAGAVFSAWRVNRLQLSRTFRGEPSEDSITMHVALGKRASLATGAVLVALAGHEVLSYFPSLVSRTWQLAIALCLLVVFLCNGPAAWLAIWPKLKEDLGEHPIRKLFTSALRAVLARPNLLWVVALLTLSGWLLTRSNFSWFPHWLRIGGL